MQAYRSRIKEKIIIKHLKAFPAVALLGARQAGKSTLAKRVIEDAIYLDLEDPRDYAKLQEPLAFLEANSRSLICIDEIQRYPDSFFFDPELSFDWRLNYIRTFLEQDIPSLGFSVPAETLKRLWTMLAHINGSVLNQSTLASSLGVSVPTIKNYLDILEGTFIIRRLKAFFTNTKKRLIKSPKIYIRDTGLIHCLLGIETYNDLLGHPALGNSYEAFIIATILEEFPRYDASFYRPSGGAEIDLVLEKGEKRIAIEIISSEAPKVSQGFYEALKVIQPDNAFAIDPIKDSFPLKDDIWVHNLKIFLLSNPMLSYTNKGK